MMKKLALFVAALIMTVDVTAYTPYECGGNTVTASGRHCEEGRTVALNGVPLGSIVIYEGHRYVVDDRCGFDNVLDIFMNDHSKAIKFGRRRREQIEVIINGIQ